MEPKDLKKPEGLESSKNAGKKKLDTSAVSNEQTETKQQPEVPEVEETLKETETSEVAENSQTVPEETEDLKESLASDSGTETEKSETADIPEEQVAAKKVADESSEPSEPKDLVEKEKQDEHVAEKEPEVETEPEEVLAEETPEVEQDKAESKTEAAEKVSDEVPENAGKEEAAKKVEPENKEESESETVAAPVAEKEKTEKKTEPAAHKNEKADYSTYSQIELVNALRELLDNKGDHDIKDDVEAIKSAFYKLVKDEADEQEKQFLEDGGDEEEFEPEENPYEQDIKDLLKRYRQIRHEFNKKLEQEKELNLQIKYDIIEEIKSLIHKEESINKTFQEFRDLQQRWREIGLVPQAKMKDLWDTYHFHVENFYDYIKINKELRDLDLKKNLEMKIRLCEQAEELLLETNTIKAFNHLQKLHERWREIGPVPRENKDDIWERFKAATAKINKKHQEYFEGRKNEQKKNLEAKRALCEQVEEINEMELTSHKEWGEKSKEVVNLQKVWRTIGFAPRKDNNKIYKRFREACDKFFDAKREFYSKNKELQQNNLQLKTELCMQAEALKDSEDWRKTTQDLINIQKQWKEIGPVPRKQSDTLWKRFRAACDYFFEKKSEHFSSIDTEQEDNLKEKEELIKEVEAFKSTGDADEDLRNLKDFQRRWTEIGHVPIKRKDDIQKQFRNAINKLFDDLKLDESKRNLLNFRTKIASFSESSRGQNKMRLERDKYMTKLKQLENDLVLLDNNIGFFAKSKNAETLIEDVKRKIEQTRDKIEFLKDKIRVIDEMDQSDE